MLEMGDTCSDLTMPAPSLCIYSSPQVPQVSLLVDSHSRRGERQFLFCGNLRASPVFRKARSSKRGLNTDRVHFEDVILLY